MFFQKAITMQRVVFADRRWNACRQKPMRILLTADPELPVPPRLYGGIERIVGVLVKEFQGRGHVVGLAAHGDSTVESAAFFPWPARRSRHLWDAARNTLALWRAVRQFKPDIVHSFSRAAYLLPLLLRVRTSRGRAVNGSWPARASVIMSYQRKPTQRQVRRAAQIGGRSLVFTGCSEHICREGRAGGGDWHAIHNCVEMSKFDFESSVSPDAPLVFLSRVERIKGAHTAIAVAKSTGRRLLVAGNHGSTGEEGRYWESEILPHIGQNGIEYVGAVNDEQKNQLLGSAAAMIVPIEWDEPFGIVFAEALACGTPVISCPRGALPEIVRDGIDGFLVNTFEEACAAVAKLPSVQRADCRRRAETEFSSDIVVEKYLDLYSELANHR
jgi:glycosyltransferase involved in cell wall biosynthesis